MSKVDEEVVIPRPANFPSPPVFETDEEERLYRKQRLAAACRLFAHFGFDEGFAGHITARDPGRPDSFWVNPAGLHFAHVRASDLLLVDANGTECAVSEGDALQLTGPPAADATAANLVVMASKGGNECRKGVTVAVNFADLQDMQNAMRETIDQGMAELQAKQGTGGLPAAPASAN